MAHLMIPCDAYGYYYSVAISYSGIVPWAIAFGIWIMHYLTGEGAYSLVSWMITLIILPLYPVQVYFNDLRNDPFCGAAFQPSGRCCGSSSFFALPTGS